MLETIGNTPLVKLRRLPPEGCAQIFLKLESFNPTHSYKDRMALAMIEAAEQRGELKPGDIVLECTGGSTGPALAFVCSVKGYRFKVISSDAYAEEKLAHMRALGAELVIEPSVDGKVTADLWPRMLKRAQNFVSQGGHYWTDQFHNLDALSGYAGMGQELLTQCQGPIDIFCGAVGTAGMLMGVGDTLRQAYPNVQLVALEPESSAALSGGRIESHNIDGLAAGFVPPLYQKEKVHKVMALSEDLARRTVRDLAVKEGIFAGTSTGLNVAAALILGRRLGPKGKVVTVACDTGLKYLRGNLYQTQNV